MSTGKIQFAGHDGVFALKFVGEVRLTLCSVLDEVIEGIFSAPEFTSIIIDLTEATNLDSTTLGLLAKLSILSRRRNGLLPTLLSTNPDISRLLESMGFELVFNMVSSPVPCPDCLRDLPAQNASEEQVKLHVLEAHRILMELNENNRAAFRDLVSALEKQ